ncbi:undecaprenyl-phosphate glucose phosphotransferase [Sandaracinus amylolyticus]|uniref:Capsular polysaccharide synthesis enzyme CpsA, sugar transferase n=1 Tax=Sandaracinus amylolyticus TaxID=927083 RepID=A0A0F6SFK1_9BACT|nr:undecaprenyl-phosphate glucose phosphotransferase [Sandaracinus amylolyticus]AKF07084.1 Capsular polysaccharide synthesis enzyme CpsA, sugar transferase [Sandaracinus amylolyticus]
MARKTGLIRPTGGGNTAGLARLADTVCIIAGYVAAVWFYDQADWRTDDTVATLLAVLAYLLVAETTGLYQTWRGVPIPKELMRVWGTWVPVIPMLLGVAFLLKLSEEFSRVATITWFVLSPLAMCSVRIVARLTLRRLREQGRNTRQVAIVGVTEIGEMLARRISTSPWLGMNILGFFDDRTPDRLPELPTGRAQLVGTFEDVVERSKRGEIDAVYIALPLRAEPRVQDLLRRLADSTASVYLVPDFFVFDLLHGRWSSLGDLPVISIFETPFYGVDGVLKRLEDVVLGTMALLVASPVMIVVSVIIKLTSKGPIFFKQRRYGLNGEVIEVLKFRSMRVAEDGPVVKQATKDDPRITPIGKFIRRTSIDELPQLFHVVGGSMSLVGPRPHAVAHNEEYRKRIQGYMLRHKVKPGLTGWAQVNGWRGETDTLEKMEKRIEHDLEYIRRWGLFFDLWIIFLTVFGRKVRQNAY